MATILQHFRITPLKYEHHRVLWEEYRVPGHMGHSQIYTPGDYADVLVAMNPAAIKANIRWTKIGGTIIYDKDSFTEKT